MPKKTYRIEEPESNWPVDSGAGLRFEIVSGEWDTGESSIRCKHWQVLDSLNSALDQLAEVVSLLEIVRRAFFYGDGR